MLTGIIATVSVPIIIQRFIFNDDDNSTNNEIISELDNSLDPELEKWLLKYSDQEECCGQNLNYAGAFTIKGRRPSMEDRFAMVEIPILPDGVDGSVVRLFSVLDGHGGQVRFNQQVNNFHFLVYLYNYLLAKFLRDNFMIEYFYFIHSMLLNLSRGT